MKVGSIGLHNLADAKFNYHSSEGCHWVDLVDGGTTSVAIHLDTDLEKRIAQAELLLNTAVTAFNRVIDSAQEEIQDKEEELYLLRLTDRIQEGADVGSNETKEDRDAEIPL